MCLKGRFDKEGNQISPPWDDPQDVVYTDENGNGYCLFHAPAEHKYKEFGSTEKFPVDEFCNLVRERIFNTPNLKGKRTECNLSGTVFPVDINFEGYEFPAINFSYSTFKGDAGFDGSTFKGNANFSNSTFWGNAWFSGSTFQGSAGFRGSKFQGDAGFEGSTFQGNATFFQSSFTREAKFQKSTFQGNAGFFHSIFQENASFVDNTFQKNARFRNNTFQKDTDFSDSTFEGNSWFSDIKKVKNTNIKFALCSTTKNILFLGCDSSCLNLINQYELEHFHFINSSWEKNGRIQIATEDVPNKLQPTRDFYQRMKAKYKAENNEYEASKWHIAEKRAQLKLLKRDFDKESWKQILSKVSLGLSVVILWLYKYSSSYGERPARALVVLIGLIALPVFPKLWCIVLGSGLFALFVFSLYQSFKMARRMPTWVLASFIFILIAVSYTGTLVAHAPFTDNIPDKIHSILSGLNFFSGKASAYIPFIESIAKEATGAGDNSISGFQIAFRAFWQLLIYIQAALLAFAVRNNFRR